MAITVIIIFTRLIQCLVKRFQNKVVKVVQVISSFITFTLLGLMYFDMLLIVFSEISSIDIARNVPFRIILSYVSSLIITMIIILEILNVDQAAKKLRKEFHFLIMEKINTLASSKTNNLDAGDVVEIKVKEIDELVKKTVCFSDKLLIDKYSEGLEFFVFLDKKVDLLILENSRFILIQVCIVSM